MNEKPEEIKSRAKTLLCEGVSPTQIAQRLSISRATLYRWKKEWEEAQQGSPEPPARPKSPYLTPEEEERARKAAQEPAAGVQKSFRGPRDREQYFQCLAEAGGDTDRVRRRASLPNEPWVVSEPPLPQPTSSPTAVYNGIYFEKQRTGKVGRVAREKARTRRIKEMLTPEYRAEVARLREKARRAIAYDVEPQKVHAA